MAFPGHPLHLVIVDSSGLRVKSVCHSLVKNAGCIDRRAVRKMSSLGKVKTHEHVARLQHSHLHSKVGLGTGMRLNIGILSSVELAEPVDGELLYLVHHLASSVVALARIALRIFVRADRTHCLEHLVRDIVFRRNKFQSLRLSLLFLSDQIKKLYILFHKLQVNVYKINPDKADIDYKYSNFRIILL